MSEQSLGSQIAILRMQMDSILKRVTRMEDRQDWLRMWVSSVGGGSLVLGFVLYSFGGLGGLLKALAP